ncbi:kinase-like protein, partial [Macrolepiota fuliginosa MF-IS2]
STPPGQAEPVLEGVRRTEPDYFACGGLADIYRGQWALTPDDTVPVSEPLVYLFYTHKLTSIPQVAIKILFLRESRLWRGLRHPHIVPFYGLFFDRDTPCLVMPYYKDGDLTNFLRKNPQVDKLDLVCQVAAGLEYLHNLKPHAIVHGDIKAANILVSDYQARLTDFGVARMLNKTGYTTTVGGTCRWMAPELLDDHQPPPTLASDVWAFGMTILQVFTGKIPFEELRIDATVVMTLVRKLLPQRPPEISETLWALLERCWAFEPSQRPAISTIFIVL